jgi:hypothetical protein
LPGGAVVAVVEQVGGEAIGSGAPLLDLPLHPGSPARREHGGQGERQQQHQRRMHDDQQHEGDAEAQHPAAGGEQRHVHVVEHEHLIAQHGEAIEIVGALVVGHEVAPTPAAPPRGIRARW